MLRLFESRLKLQHNTGGLCLRRLKIQPLCQLTEANRPSKLLQLLFSNNSVIFVPSHQNICCRSLKAHPDGLQGLDLLVQAAVDVTGVEKRISSDLAQQVPGKVADVVLAEVPLSEHSAGNNRLGVFMATLAEVPAEVVAVTQPLDVVWGKSRNRSVWCVCGGGLNCIGN